MRAPADHKCIQGSSMDVQHSSRVSQAPLPTTCRIRSNRDCTTAFKSRRPDHARVSDGRSMLISAASCAMARSTVSTGPSSRTSAMSSSTRPWLACGAKRCSLTGEGVAEPSSGICSARRIAGGRPELGAPCSVVAVAVLLVRDVRLLCSALSLD